MTKQLADWLQRLEKGLSKLAKVICMVLLAATIIDVSISVASRYFFYLPLNYADQLAKYFIIWMAFLGSSVALSERSHVVINHLADKLPFTLKRFNLIFSDLMVSVFLIVVIFEGAKFAWEARTMKDPLVFGLNMMYPFLSVPICLTFLLIQFNIVTFIDIFEMNKER